MRKKWSNILSYLKLKKEKTYIEDELLVFIFPSQASPETDEPNQYENGGNNAQNVSHDRQGKSRYT